jgi:hypothetical protein
MWRRNIARGRLAAGEEKPWRNEMTQRHANQLRRTHEPEGKSVTMAKRNSGVARRKAEEE